MNTNTTHGTSQLVRELHAAADFIDTHGATIPTPVFAYLYITTGDPDQVEAFAKQHPDMSARSDYNGCVRAEKRVSDLLTMRLIADARGTL